MFNRKHRLFTGTLILALFCAAPAQAYVDPGTGGMLYQLVIMAAAVVAGGFAIFKTKLRNFFAKSKGEEADPGEPQD